MLLFHVYRWSLGWMHQSINRGAMEVVEGRSWTTRWYWREWAFGQYCVLQLMWGLGNYWNLEIILQCSNLLKMEILKTTTLWCASKGTQNRKKWCGMVGATCSTFVSQSCMATIMQSCHSARTHALLNNAPTTIIYVDVLIVIKFNMAQAKHNVKGYNIVYKVPQEVHEHILGEVSLFNA